MKQITEKKRRIKLFLQQSIDLISCFPEHFTTLGNGHCGEDDTS